MRESFLVYKSFYEPLKGLSDDDFGKIFKSVFEYQIEGKKPEISPLLMMAFSFIKDALDRDNLKYQMIVERNSNNGKSGGRPKKEPQKPSGLSGNRKNPKNPSEADNDTVTDNDTVNVKEKEKEEVKEKEIYLSRDHLSITWGEMNKLIDKYGEQISSDMVNRVLNYRKNSKYKSLYLTALEWIKRDIEKNKPIPIGERPKSKLTI